jgi:hypothetical protein
MWIYGVHHLCRRDRPLVLVRLVSVSDDSVLKLSGLVGIGLENLKSWPIDGMD